MGIEITKIGRILKSDPQWSLALPSSAVCHIFSTSSHLLSCITQNA